MNRANLSETAAAVLRMLQEGRAVEGLDLPGGKAELYPAIRELREAGVKVRSYVLGRGLVFWVPTMGKGGAK